MYSPQHDTILIFYLFIFLLLFFLIFIHWTAATDIVPLTEMLTFDPVSVTTQCRSVLVVDDSALEDNEVIQISIESSDSAAVIVDPTASATIIDTDSESRKILY